MENDTGNFSVNGTGDAGGSGSYWYVYAPISCSSVVINLFMAILILSRRLISADVPKVFITNQMVSDTIASAINAIAWILGEHFVVPVSTLGDVICRIWLTRMFFWSTVQTSIMNVIMMTVERYLSVVHPVWSRQHMNRSVALRMVAFTWVFGLMTEFPSYFGSRRIDNHCTYLSFGHDAQIAWGAVLLCSFFLLPFIGLLFWNIRILQALRSHQHSRGAPGRTKSARQSVTNQLTLAMRVIAIAYIVCFAPNSILICLYLMSALTPNYTSILYEMTRLLVNLYFICNPLLYIVTMRPVREELKRMVGCCGRKSENEVSTVYRVEVDSAEANAVANSSVNH